MPNYGLVVTPQYNPMSYEQYIQPFKEYAQVYNATADQIDALEMEANQWERLADSDIDAPQYQQYKKYADDLRGYANDLATQGLSSKTRAGLSRMRQRYAKEIKPIEEAFNYRQKMAEEQRKLNPKGDIQWDVDFSNIGLGTIMANPSIGYSGRSLSEMENEGFEQAKALSSRVLSEPAKIMGNQYFRIRQGVSAQEADAWLASQAESNPEAVSEVNQYINDIYGQIRKSYGTDGTDTRYSMSQNVDADKRIASGILKGLSLNEAYQANKGYDYWAGRYYGSGDDSNQYKDLIFRTSLKDKDGNQKIYEAIINQNGDYEYYDADTKVKVEDTDTYNALSKTIPVPVAGLKPHDDNKDLVDLIDYATGQPMTQGPNRTIISFNRTTHDINPVTGEIIPKTTDTPVLGGTNFVVVKTASKERKLKKGSIYTKSDKDFDNLKQPSLTYNQLTEEEKNALPDNIKNSPSSYIFKRTSDDASGLFTGDNEGLLIKNVTTVKTEQNVSNLEDSQINNMYIPGYTNILLNDNWMKKPDKVKPVKVKE